MASISIAIPSKVFISANPSAPALITSPAIETISVTSGESFTMIGSSPPTFLLTDSTTDFEATGSQAKTIPRFSTFGQEILTSIPLIPATPLNFRASDAYSSIVSPEIETITRAFFAISQGISSARNWSIPGPCNPIELSIPLGVSAIRGVARPDRGLTEIDLVTTAPSSSKSKN